ncbi:hypothetical protein AJ80_02553 [Polytolypa hystricis UAMH7299]|uniref:Ysc84 actin-binding domain-containing protein n=1 Tax=Polytolypa hystricis (strain UAMH7299) TaxID=1447883 RepID=A0A2B7YR25_POLH7|nr:hypothetical protein AJ80_02553 [Polytolypa hystricis UAMH7299]
MSGSKWEKTKGYSKRGFDKAWHTLDKLGDPVNRLSNKLGAEAFWPTTLDKESDKAARILQSFCKDGFYAQVEEEGNGGKESVHGAEKSPKEMNGDVSKERIEGPRGKQRVVKKIPAEVIKKAKGLAIFTTMRTGLWFSGAGGSGILVARVKETGEWSPPSGIMLHTAGLGFLIGVDIYDCVVVINTYEALDAFKKVRCTLGGEVSAVAGPVGVGGVVETEVHKRQAPVWTYLKSRGFYAGVQVDGTIVIERTDENERFYGERIPVGDILAGKAKYPPSSINTLMQTIKAAQGDRDVDESLLPPPGEAPGDVELTLETSFGIPDEDDPDPYGVRALESEGVIIREAGTRTIPNVETFEFRPSPNSPIFSNRSRLSMDSSKRTSWRTSVQSAVSINRGTQTDDLNGDPPASTSSPVSRASQSSFKDVSLNSRATPLEVTATSTNGSPTRSSGRKSPPAALILHDQTSADVPSPTSPTFARPRLVTIPKRNPPPLPPRNPERRSSSPLSPVSVSPILEGAETRSVSPVSTFGEDMLQMGTIFSYGAEKERMEPPDPRDSPHLELLENDVPVSSETQTSDRLENEKPEKDSAADAGEKDEFHSVPGSPRSTKSPVDTTNEQASSPPDEVIKETTKI